LFFGGSQISLVEVEMSSLKGIVSLGCLLKTQFDFAFCVYGELEFRHSSECISGFEQMFFQRNWSIQIH